jgi:hypothetical protein
MRRLILALTAIITAAAGSGPPRPDFLRGRGPTLNQLTRPDHDHDEYIFVHPAQRALASPRHDGEADRGVDRAQRSQDPDLPLPGCEIPSFEPSIRGRRLDREAHPRSSDRIALAHQPGLRS